MVYKFEIIDEAAYEVEVASLSWRLPYMLELSLYYIIFFAVSFQIFKLKKATIEEIYKGKNVLRFIFFKLLILLICYGVFLANHKIGRRVLYTVLPRSVKDSFVIDCDQKTIQFGFIKYNKESSLCTQVASSCSFDPNKKCVYRGLDVP